MLRILSLGENFTILIKKACMAQRIFPAKNWTLNDGIWVKIENLTFDDVIRRHVTSSWSPDKKNQNLYQSNLGKIKKFGHQFFRHLQVINNDIGLWIFWSSPSRGRDKIHGHLSLSHEFFNVAKTSCNASAGEMSFWCTISSTQALSGQQMSRPWSRASLSSIEISVLHRWYRVVRQLFSGASVFLSLSWVVSRLLLSLRRRQQTGRGRLYCCQTFSEMNPSHLSILDFLGNVRWYRLNSLSFSHMLLIVAESNISLAACAIFVWIMMLTLGSSGTR